MKRNIHTSISIDTKKWLEEEAERQHKNVCDIIEEIVVFYRSNKELPEKYKHAEFYLRDVIRNILDEEREKNAKRKGYRYLRSDH